MATQNITAASLLASGRVKITKAPQPKPAPEVFTAEMNNGDPRLRAVVRDGGGRVVSRHRSWEVAEREAAKRTREAARPAGLFPAFTCLTRGQFYSDKPHGMLAMTPLGEMSQKELDREMNVQLRRLSAHEGLSLSERACNSHNLFLENVPGVGPVCAYCEA